jgi:LmbE family N-acetylglucosaminyl deacetylase
MAQPSDHELVTAGREALARLRGRRLLVVVPHADDPTLFCGGTLAAMADGGVEVVVLRATTDDKDSLGLPVDETVRRNADEFAQAMAVLGVRRHLDLGLESDVLGDASEVALRERVVRAIRRELPYAVMGFDPYGAFFEDNQDHVALAQATDEACWTAAFDKHHPEHREDALHPHAVVERWYFARRLLEVTTVVDTEATLARQVDAALAHRTMLEHILHGLRLQAHAAGWDTGQLDRALEGPPRPFVERLLRARAARCGAARGLAAAEELRVVWPADLRALLEEEA